MADAFDRKQQIYEILCKDLMINDEKTKYSQVMMDIAIELNDDQMIKFYAKKLHYLHQNRNFYIEEAKNMIKNDKNPIKSIKKEIK